MNTTTASSRDLVVFISSTRLGEGDEVLGAQLMSSFLGTLAQFEGQISHLLLVNGGARLVVEGSPVLDPLRRLEEQGVEIMTCGTCLRHFGVEDRVEVGSVSGMYAIVETLSRAGRTIQL